MQLSEGTLLKNGEYRIVRALGQGGFGITYEAEQINLGRKVAVKEFFMKDYCDRSADTSVVSVPTASSKALVDKFKEKFLKEARMIAALAHPHIVRVFDVFEENGTAYYVMENLPGGSLADLVKRNGPLPESRADKYIRQIADALSYIHAKNLVHLDVKPSNILLNSKGDAVLIDFGVSKHYDSGGHQTTSTPVGYSNGFAPLEQMQTGDVKLFTPATDIYSLGATLLCILTGIVPADASLLLEEGLSRPAGISPRFWRAIESAMQPKRKDRVQSVDAFLALLDGKAGTQTSTQPEVILEPEADERTVVIGKPKPASESPVPPKKKSFPIWAVICEVAVVVLAVFVILRANSAKYRGSTYGHDWVDLGTGVKWATTNLGAYSPEGYGDYFAWGEEDHYYQDGHAQDNPCRNWYFGNSNGYHWDTYIWRSGTKNTKYNSYDYRRTLELADDAASKQWGSSWRMPTRAELVALMTQCDWKWTSVNGVYGYKVKSRKFGNWNSIFLPAAGRRNDWAANMNYQRDSIGYLKFLGKNGYYWSSSLDTDDKAFMLQIYSGYKECEGYYRFVGFSIRPVTD